MGCLNMNNKKTEIMVNEDEMIENLCAETVALVRYARNIAVQQVNMIQLLTYYAIGKWIVDVQQKGESRAKYGGQVIKRLSEEMQKNFKRGFSEDSLKNARKFYLVYKDRISEKMFNLFAVEKSETVFSFFENKKPFAVSWSHYLQLMRIENEEERNFYEIESAKSGWSVRTLQRQYNSSLYERLALSRDKEAVLQLAKEGGIVATLEKRKYFIEGENKLAIVSKDKNNLIQICIEYCF